MDKKIETILNEIYLLDPTLKSQEGNLRAVVTQLISSKPDSSIDKNFVSELRYNLLNEAKIVHAQVSKSSTLHTRTVSWWIPRLAPLGVIALILIFTTQPGVPLPENDMFMTQMVDENSLNVNQQNPGKDVIVDFVILKNSGFIAIHEDINGSIGNIIGVSKIMEIGRTENVRITLSRATNNEETLYAALYEDDGNRTFSRAGDDAVLDTVLGVPMYMTFIVSTNTVNWGINE